MMISPTGHFLHDANRSADCWSILLLASLAAATIVGTAQSAVASSAEISMYHTRMSVQKGLPIQTHEAWVVDDSWEKRVWYKSPAFRREEETRVFPVAGSTNDFPLLRVRVVSPDGSFLVYPQVPVALKSDSATNANSVESLLSYRGNLSRLLADAGGYQRLKQEDGFLKSTLDKLTFHGIPSIAEPPVVCARSAVQVHCGLRVSDEWFRVGESRPFYEEAYTYGTNGTIMTSHLSWYDIPIPDDVFGINRDWLVETRTAFKKMLMDFLQQKLKTGMPEHLLAERGLTSEWLLGGP